MATRNVKVGDVIICRASWGADKPKRERLSGIERTKEEGSKNGDEVDSVKWIDGKWEFPFICDMENGHWAYSYQIKPEYIAPN